MSEDLYTTMWFDPGGTSGWAILCLYDGVIGPEPFDLWKNSYGGGPGTEAEWNEAAKLAWKAEQAEAGCYKILDNIAFWSCGQLTGHRNVQVDAMVELTEAWPPETVLGMEGFTLRQFRMDPILLEPVRIIAAFEYAVRDLGPSGRLWRRNVAAAAGSAEPIGRRRMVLQQPPSLAMSMVTDDRLRRMTSPTGERGVYHNGTAGRPHARDALRHAFTFLRREKEARSHGKSLHLTHGL